MLLFGIRDLLCILSHSIRQHPLTCLALKLSKKIINFQVFGMTRPRIIQQITFTDGEHSSLKLPSVVVTRSNRLFIFHTSSIGFLVVDYFGLKSFFHHYSLLSQRS